MRITLARTQLQLRASISSSAPTQPCRPSQQPLMSTSLRARAHTHTHTHTHTRTRTPLTSTSLRSFTQAIQRNVSIADTDLSFSNSPAAPIPTPPSPSSSPLTKASSPRPTGLHNAAAKRGIMERCPRSSATVPWMEFLGFCGRLLPLRRSPFLGAHTPQMTPPRPHLR